MIFFGDFLLLNLSYFQKSLVSLENQTTMLKLFITHPAYLLERNIVRPTFLEDTQLMKSDPI